MTLKRKVRRAEERMITRVRDIADGLREYPDVQSMRLALLSTRERKVYKYEFDAWLMRWGTTLDREIGFAMVLEMEMREGN